MESNHPKITQQVPTQEPKEIEWQGFEQFQDTSEHPTSQSPHTQLTPQPNQQQNLYDVSPQKGPSRHRTPRRKKSEVRIELPADLSLSPAHDKSLKLSSNSAKQEAPVPSRRYQRIPIIRWQQDCRRPGKVIYKNFVPRTSDNYLRLLREVDFSSNNDKKRDIRNLHGIEFSSQFQGGNLGLAIEYSCWYVRVADLEYDLYMRVDSNTAGHRQWFYFSMKNQRKCRIKLHIYRFKKLYSLFQRGMRPYVRSRRSGNDWLPAGDNVAYHYEKPKKEANGGKKEGKSFVLSFTYTFQHENDEVFVAAGIPYSYTFLQKQLTHMKAQADMRENLSFQVTTLGKSMCGLDLPLITVQHRSASAQREKKFIVINARTHSGEASSSWVLDGLLMEVVGGSSQMEEWLLADNICLKIVPMLNPDGVFIGNYRTGIVGDDFNRKFHSGRREFYPEIFALKKLIGHCKKEGEVELFLDLHGHSILKNSFLYGPDESYSSRFRLRTLPYHLLHNSKYFRLASCKFRAERQNIQTARVFFQLKEDILTFTCENSLGLYYSQYQTFQMLHGDWQAFGQALLRSIIDSFTSKNTPTNLPLTLSPPRLPHRHSVKGKISSEFDKRMTEVLKPQTSKHGKNEKGGLRLPTANKSTATAQKQHLDPIDNTFSFSHQMMREDDLLQPKQFSYHERPTEGSDGRGFNLRRKSEVMKVPKSNLAQRIIYKHRPQRKSSVEEDQQWLCMGRSSTSDASSGALQAQIQALQGSGQQLEMEVINEDFSEGYVSMNDSDSEGDNLPQQEKNYLFEYIKANQHKAVEEEQPQQRHPSEKQEKRMPSREQKISRFREIRFKSIEELYQCQAETQPVRAPKKPKLQPHKFKDNTSKSLIYKYNEILSQGEFDDPSMVAFSHQKRLNERNQLRRAQKDPFVLYHRKEKHPE